MAINFTKMHGLGNDYLFIEGSVEEPDALARAMSHRHLGAGSDGIVLILPGESAEFRMRMFNADGSEAETCGNGIRCFAKYVFEHGLTDKTEFAIDTLAGPNRVQLRVAEGTVESVRSNMGKPKFERADIPMEGHKGKVIDDPIKISDQTFNITAVNIGNPHAVCFVDDATTIKLDVVGPQIENHPKFPQRTNVEFVHIVDRDNIVMRIWERGSGITMASGSGSCGAALAAMITERVNKRVNVHLVYGALTVEWADDGCVYQEGPATEVYSGVWHGTPASAHIAEASH